MKQYVFRIHTIKYGLYFELKTQSSNDTFCYELPCIKKAEERVNFIQCTNLAAKIAPTAVEAPSHLLPAWAASGPDWHSYDSELPTGLWMFVQQTDSHLYLLASEESPPSSVNRTIKNLTITVRLSHLTLLCYLNHENIEQFLLCHRSLRFITRTGCSPEFVH